MSAIDQAVKNAILNHYIGQSGGAFAQYPVFRGSSVQYGNGIGDIFRSIGRFLMPIFSSSAKTFVQSAAQGLSEGKSLSDAAKGALKPTLTRAVQDTTEGVMQKVRGGGRRKRRRSKRKSVVKKRRASKHQVYKGRGKRRTKHRSKKTFKKFLASNF